MASLDPFTTTSKKHSILPKGDLQSSQTSHTATAFHPWHSVITAQRAAKKLPEGVSAELCLGQPLAEMPASPVTGLRNCMRFRAHMQKRKRVPCANLCPPWCPELQRVCRTMSVNFEELLLKQRVPLTAGITLLLSLHPCLSSSHRPARPAFPTQPSVHPIRGRRMRLPGKKSVCAGTRLFLPHD